MDKRESLQTFAELACYDPAVNENYVIADPSHPENRSRAEKWFSSSLNFLGKRDAQELKEVWACAIDDGRDVRTLLSAVKFLQDKYAD